MADATTTTDKSEKKTDSESKKKDKKGFKKYLGLTGAGVAVFIVLFVIYKVVTNATDDSQQQQQQIVGTNGNQTSTTITPSAPGAVVTVLQSPFSGPIANGYHRILINGETGTTSIESNDKELADKVSAYGTEVSKNYNNVDQARKMKDLEAKLASQEQRLNDAEKLVTAHRQQIAGKMDKTATVVIIHPAEPVNTQRYRPVFTTSYMPGR